MDNVNVNVNGAALEFDSLEPISVPVKIKDQPGKSYILKEASGDASAKFKSASARMAKMADGKIVGIENAGEIEPMLVSWCLFEMVTHPGLPAPMEQPVPLMVVKGWKGGVVGKLFAEVLRLSPDLQPKETAEFLEKRIAADTAKLDAIRSGAAVPNQAALAP